MRVLMIEDEAALRIVIRQMLERAGHEVTEAENEGRSAGRLLQKPAPTPGA
jgi:CheY-like chemotaxis protein